MRGAATAVRWVAHPVTAVAALVLLFNDHLFKPAWPGLVTGKLSDVAGLVVAPPLLGLAIGVAAPRVSPRVLAGASVVLTGAGFAWVKLTAPGAAAASAAWSLVAGPSYVLADPADLVALPALAAAWWTWRCVRREPQPSEAMVTRVRVLVGLPLAVLAVAATSAPMQPDAVTVVEEIDGDVVIAGNMMPHRGTTGVDGWVRLSDAETAGYELDPERDLSQRRQGEACVPDEPRHCYRVWGHSVPFDTGRDAVPVGGRLLGVDETLDGGLTWRTAWEVPAERWKFLAERHGLYRPRDDVLLASVDILVREVPGGHQVIVANGVDGLAVRHPDGTWRRVAVSVPAASPDGRPVDIRPLPLTGFGQGLALQTAVGLFVAMLGLLIAASLAAWRMRRVRGAAVVIWPTVVGAGILASVPGFMVLTFVEAMSLTLFAVYAATAVAVVAAMMQRDLPVPRALAVAGAGLLVGVGFVAPYLGWTAGVPADYRTAVWLGWVLTAVALVPAALIAWWAGGAPNPPGPSLRPWRGRQSPGSGAPSKSTTE